MIERVRREAREARKEWRYRQTTTSEVMRDDAVATLVVAETVHREATEPLIEALAHLAESVRRDRNDPEKLLVHARQATVVVEQAAETLTQRGEAL
jgi:hypothetical protein